MASNVVDLSARRRARDARSPPRPFEAVAVHLLSLEKRTGTKEDQAVVCEEISKMAHALEADLAEGGSTLRRRVENHVRTMASGAPDPISPEGVEFRDPSTGAVIVLGDGEANSSGAAGKIDAIVNGCMSAAASDLEFLNAALSSMESGKGLSGDALRTLREILSGNAYWRFLKTL